MRKVIQLRLIALFFINFQNTTKAEGTYELLNGSCSNYGYIQIWDNNDSQRDFATYNCAESSRLNIRLQINEHMYFGYATDVEDVYYRIKDPNGNIVKGPTLITSASSRGWITTCAKALTGPDSTYVGGYKCLGIIAAMSGDYYIEFAVNNNASNYSKRIFNRFDITVSNAGVVKEGRVWSKKWDFTTNGSTNTFLANLYVYTLDSVVTQINFNGIKPFGFTVSCNSYGATEVGDLKQQRKSNYKQTISNEGGTPGAPEYKLFLNDPDNTLYPTGSVGYVSNVTLETCREDTNCISITVNKPGQVEVKLIFPNGTSRTYIQNVNAGVNCIVWDGKNGNGVMLSANSSIQIETNYLRGMTHLPMTDVEDHANGFIVTLLRPSIDWNGNLFPNPILFWNDSLLTDPVNSLDGISNLAGCSGGCHKWASRGTNNANPEVINTWWYISQQKDTTIQSCNIVLSLELIEFSGENNGLENNLFWSTESEENLNNFIVERSIDNFSFEELATLNAANTAFDYKYSDKNLSLHASQYYYRLKIISLSGEFYYSPIIVVYKNNSINTPFNLYPNPSNGGDINLFLSDIKAPTAVVSFINMHGEIVFKQDLQKNKDGNFSAVFNSKQLISKGIYLVNFITANEFLSTSIMIK